MQHAMSKDAAKDDSYTSSIAQARWRLLRAALQGVAPEKSDQSTTSIHRFPGFQLLSRRADNEFLVEKLLQQPANEQNLEYLLWAIHSCRCTEKGVTITLLYDEQALSPNLRATLATRGMLCKPLVHSNQLSAHLPPNTEYTCVSYSLGNHTVRVRERLPRNKVRLESLMSHALHNGVDNTGNTRVWDSETTLVFLLLQEPWTITSTLNISSLWDLRAENAKLQVLELGCGMAGLASLFLATMEPKQTTVVLTDGHPQAVHNNLVHLALNPHLAHCEITSKRLVWSTDNDNNTISRHAYDLILASDCTHFQEFHACLACTIADNLRIGGVAILLQPPRGNSLANFVACLESSHDLMQIQLFESDYSETLSRLLDQHVGTAEFDVDIHYPQLLILKKLREVTHEDRVAMTRHVEEREQSSRRSTV